MSPPQGALHSDNPAVPFSYLHLSGGAAASSDADPRLNPVFFWLSNGTKPLGMTELPHDDSQLLLSFITFRASSPSAADRPEEMSSGPLRLSTNSGGECRGGGGGLERLRARSSKGRACQTASAASTLI